MRRYFSILFCLLILPIQIVAQFSENSYNSESLINYEPFNLFYKDNEAILAEQLSGVVAGDWKNVLFYDSRLGKAAPITTGIQSVWQDGQFYMLVDSLNKPLTQKFTKYELLANQLLLLSVDDNQNSSYGLFDLKSGKLILPFTFSEIREINYQNLVGQQMINLGLMLVSDCKSTVLFNYQLDTLATFPFEVKKIEFQKFEANKSSCAYNSESINPPKRSEQVMHYGIACTGFNTFNFVTDCRFQKIIHQSKNTDHLLEELPGGALYTLEENAGKLAALIYINGQVTKVPLLKPNLALKSFCEASLFGFVASSVYDTLPYAFSASRFEIRNTSKLEFPKLHPDLFPDSIQQNVNFFRSSDFSSSQSTLFWINDRQECKVLPKIKSTDWETLTITPKHYIMNYGKSTLLINRMNNLDIFLLEVPEVENFFTISPQMAVIQSDIDGELKYGLYDISARKIIVKANYDQLFMSEANKIYGASSSGIYFLCDFK